MLSAIFILEKLAIQLSSYSDLDASLAFLDPSPVIKMSIHAVILKAVSRSIQLQVENFDPAFTYQWIRGIANDAHFIWEVL